MVLVNKQDLEGAKSVEEITKILNIPSQQDKRTCLVHGISAKTGDGKENLKSKSNQNTNKKLIGIKEGMEKLAKALKNEVKNKKN